MQNDLTNEIIKTVLAIATPAIAALMTALLVRALQRLGLAVDAEREAKLQYLATQAILRAEEWAASRVKANIGQTTAAMKLERALSDLTDRVPGITREEAAALVHATLPKVNLGAASFLQGVREAATTGERPVSLPPVPVPPKPSTTTVRPIGDSLQHHLDEVLAQIPSGRRAIVTGAVTNAGAQLAIGSRVTVLHGADLGVSGYAGKMWGGSGWEAGARASIVF